MAEFTDGMHNAADEGAIAQLGERVVRNDEVGGSIPPGSTNLQDNFKTSPNTTPCFPSPPAMH